MRFVWWWWMLCALGVASPAWAASSHAVEAPADGALLRIDALWATHTVAWGDLAPASAGFDDSAWPLYRQWVETEAAAMPWARSETWYRAEIRLPAALDLPFALALVCRNADTAVWIDGQRAPGGCGAERDPPVTAGRTPWTLPLPPGRTHQIAVRTRRSPNVSLNLTRFPHWSELHAVVGPTSAANAWADSQGFLHAGDAAVRLILAFVSMALALFHAVLYSRRPDLNAYFWFAVSAACMTAWELESGATRLPDGYAWHAGWAVQNGVMWTWFGITALLAFAVWYVNGRPRGAMRALITAGLVLGAIKLIPGVFWLHLQVFVLEQSLVLVPMLTGTALLVTAVVQRRPGAITLLIAGSPGVLLASLQVLAIVPAVHIGPIGIPLASIGFVVLMSGVAIVLAVRFAETLDVVDARNDELTRTNAAIRRFVPEAFLAQLGRRNITEVQRGDQVERDMAVLFADIRGFTSLSEGLTPRQNFALVNEYLQAMEPHIRENGGFIDKYIGDAIMALFPGAPDARPGEQGLAAAMGMVHALDALNATRATRGEPPIRIGVGLHVGHLMLGTVGAEGRLEGTVISDAVNLASRVESLTKRYGANILISDAVLAELASPPLHREVDRVAVKGRAAPIDVFDVFAADTPAEQQRKQDGLAALIQALAAWRAGRFDDARAAFDRLGAPGEDAVADLYRERLKDLGAAPTDPSWDGTYRARTK